MHECPECGQACDCDGEDTWIGWPANVDCQHDCEDEWCEDSDGGYEDYLDDQNGESMNNILHVYANEVVEWMVAESPDDAEKVWEETTGMKYEEEDGGTFEQEPDDKILWIGFEENDKETERKTCREWANEKGRCYLCSTEY